MGNHKVISETWRGTGSSAPLARALRSLGGVINNPHGVNGINAYVRGGRLVIEGRMQSSIDFSQFCFGFKIYKSTVTIIGGDWPVGGCEPLELPDTDVNISQDLQYVGIEVDPLDETISVIGPSTNKSVFSSDSVKFRTWLHLFNYSGGSAVFKKTKLGSLFMPSTFGTPQ